MIGEQYGRYKILMYYDNVCNQANGDDLWLVVLDISSRKNP
jgi:hypothetical protein